MDRHLLSAALNEVGLLLELAGENPYKSRAYYQAARSIENLEQDLEELWRDGRIETLPGFGVALVAAVGEYITTGHLRLLDELKAKTPAGLIELLRIPGLGPKKVRALYRQLGIDSLEGLEQACHEHKLATEKGFGAKSEMKILSALEAVRAYQGRYLPWLIAPEVHQILTFLRGLPGVVRAEVAGSFRRRKEVIKDLDFVVASTENIAPAIFEAPWAVEALSTGEAKPTVRLSSGIAADFRLVTSDSFASAWLHFTGSAAHNTELRQLAKAKGLKLNEYGLFGEDGKSLRTFMTEEEEYRALGLPWIPPELREGMGEIEAALEGRLPRLAAADDLKGVFHCHTEASDGRTSLRDMAKAAREMGFSYLGIADHSQSAKYARGLSVERLLQQGYEIDGLNRQWNDFRILKGVECDILPDGSLDYPDEVLDSLDYVVASVHSSFHLDREAMTQRIARAMQNPRVTMIGHPTGRILLGRQGYDLDLDRLLKVAAETGVALEFNANPHRYDLDWRWCREAVHRGVKLVINPDAHRIEELGFTFSGLEVLRKGWVLAKDLLNCETAENILAKRHNL